MIIAIIEMVSFVIRGSVAICVSELSSQSLRTLQIYLFCLEVGCMQPTSAASVIRKNFCQD